MALLDRRVLKIHRSAFLGHPVYTYNIRFVYYHFVYSQLQRRYLGLSLFIT